MSYFFVALVSLAGIVSIKEEKDKKRKHMFILLYLALVGVALLFVFGEFVGQMIYKIENL